MISRDYLSGLFSLAGKRALVTGASRGLGLAFAEALASAGAHVVLSSRNEAGLAEAAEVLRLSEQLHGAIRILGNSLS